MSLDVNKIRKDFPILHQQVNGKPLIYFDNAATTQKPQAMIDNLVEYYSKYNANIHRGVHTLSQQATEMFERTRALVADIYGCKITEVIFTKNDTESLNLIANSLGTPILNNNSNIVLSDLEHHSNIVPWQLIKDDKRFEIRYVKFNEDGLLDLNDLKSKVDQNTKILSINWCSNTFGMINPAADIIKLARSINPNLIVILDAAQAVPHTKFNFAELDADFLTFSGHKLCGPTGVGILIGKESWLKEMKPFLGGGDMIREVGWEATTFNDLPYKFEAGTPNIADVIAFYSSLKYLNDLGFENIFDYERELISYLLDKLNNLDFVEVYGTKDISNPNKIALVSFNLKNIHAHDVGTLLDEDGIAVRTGHHCTQLIMKRLNIPASVRASLYIYNTKDEIDELIKSLYRISYIFT